MQRFIIAFLIGLIGSTAFAGPYCNPPAPGMSFDQWDSVCAEEIDYAYQVYGGGMNYDYFVENLYGMYLNPPQQQYNGGVTPMAQCSPEGSTQCNSSGWLYTCTNGQWLTGSVKCGG